MAHAGGRPKKPTHLKLLEGNPGKRPISNLEPKPKPIAPTAPAWMQPTAKTMWKHLAPQLEQLGLLTSIDGKAFEAACESYATWVKCQKFIQKNGMTYESTGQSGLQIKPRPEVNIGHSALMALKAFLIEFGLTPSSRAGLEVKPSSEELDPMEAMLKSKGG